MGLFRFYRISKPSPTAVADNEVKATYKSLRNRTFWGATAAYSLFYLCRLSMGVVKKPLIDEGLFSAAELHTVWEEMISSKNTFLHRWPNLLRSQCKR